MGWFNANLDPRFQKYPSHYLALYTIKNILFTVVSLRIILEPYKHCHERDAPEWGHRP
jgi:hypothetical protein